MPYKKVKDGVTIEVRVEPRSSREEIRDVTGGVLKVKLTAPPVDGAANSQLIKLISKEFGVKKSAVKVIRGERSRNKVVKIEGIEVLGDLV